MKKLIFISVLLFVSIANGSILVADYGETRNYLDEFFEKYIYTFYLISNLLTVLFVNYLIIKSFFNLKVKIFLISLILGIGLIIIYFLNLDFELDYYLFIQVPILGLFSNIYIIYLIIKKLLSFKRKVE